MDATFEVNSTTSSWQATGIQIERGDRFYLFGLGSVFYGYPHEMISVVGPGRLDSLHASTRPAPELGGMGIVAKVGTAASFGVGNVFGQDNSPWSGQLYLGLNDQYHGDNSGKAIVGMLIHRGTGGVDEHGEPEPISTQLAIQGNPVVAARGARISYELKKGGNARLLLVDRAGRSVAVLLEEPTAAGQYCLEWNGRTRAGVPIGSGTYFCILDVDGEVTSRQLVVVR